MSTDAILTDDELAELLGVKQPAAQLRALRRRGIEPFVRSDGRPRVTYEAVTRAMLAKPEKSGFKINWGPAGKGKSRGKGKAA